MTNSTDIGWANWKLGIIPEREAQVLFRVSDLLLRPVRDPLDQVRWQLAEAFCLPDTHVRTIRVRVEFRTLEQCTSFGPPTDRAAEEDINFERIHVLG